MTQTGSDGVGIPGTGFNSIGDNLGDAGMIAFGTVAGGAGAALTGGNFWQGAVTGLVVSGLNHAMHSDGGPDDPPAKVRTQESDKAEGWTNSQFRDLYESCEFIIDAYGYVRGAAEFSALKLGGFVAGVKGLFSSGSKVLVQFGKNENQIYHAFRHIESMGLDQTVVKNAILKDITRISKTMPYGQSVNTTINVSNQQIIYSSYKLSNGTINVGRITGLTR